MIMEKEELKRYLTEEQQREEIQRIQEAPDSLVLYKACVADKESAKVYQTLFAMSGCDYHETFLLSRGIIKWVKGSIRMHYEVA